MLERIPVAISSATSLEASAAEGKVTLWILSNLVS